MAPAHHAVSPAMDTAHLPSIELASALLANSSDAVVTVDANGVICGASSGAGRLFGYDPAASVGTSVFSFLHPDDIDDAGELFRQRMQYDGRDLGHGMRIQHSSGQWVDVIATAALLPPSPLGVVAITLTSTDAAAANEASLRARLAAEEFTVGLGTDFMEAVDADAILGRIDSAVADLGLLTGADLVAVFVERYEHDVLERLTRWIKPSLSNLPGVKAIDSVKNKDAVEVALTTPLVIDDLASFWDGDRRVSRDVQATAMMSAPFVAGSQRGVVAALRIRQGPPWSDADVQLLRNTAKQFGPALRTARTEQLLALTYDQGPIGFSVWTEQGHLVNCNQQYLDLQDLTRERVGQRHLRSLLHPDDADWMGAELDLLESGEISTVNGDCRIVLADLSTRWLRLNAVRLKTTGWSEPLISISLEDVTENHTQRMALEFSALHDALTGVANRTELWRRMLLFEQENDRLPNLLIVDLDRFKMVNDSFGHSVGDEVLIAFAGRIVKRAGVLDVVARLGGDEFAIMVNDPSEERASVLASEIRRAMEQPLVADGRSMLQTVSIGVALGRDCADPAELLVHADRAMYAAKERGRNSFAVFDDTMRNAVLSRLAMECDLRHALDHDELEVHFQPEFEVDGGAIVGAEALLRWRHPTLGLLSAGYFVEVAEQSGLMDELGRLALRNGCLEFAKMMVELDEPDLMLRINISGREFARPELPDLVRCALDDSGLAPDRLCLEMTETTLMDSPEVALETFVRLRDIGVTFAIDDFGTGYSSLVYLKRFPVDALKIDRSFIDDITSDSDSRAIVESILGLASALSLEVVAEGVETQSQLDLLAEMGCTRAQGFLVSGALAPLDFVALISFGPATD